MLRECNGQLQKNDISQGPGAAQEDGAAASRTVRRKEPADAALVLCQRSVKGRVPALVKLKYERMMVSPFGYFRGAVPVMAADSRRCLIPGSTWQLCGDAHVRNLGAYAAEDGPADL